MWIILYLVLLILFVGEEFSKCMMSMMGELSFFLGFQIKQLKDDIFVNQEKYTKIYSKVQVQ